MIDASKGFIKDGNKNRLREQDIHKIVDTFNKQTNTHPLCSPSALRRDFADSKNDYNLNLPRYIDSTEPEDIQDIDGHLRGGIPNQGYQCTGGLLEGDPRRSTRTLRKRWPPRLFQAEVAHCHREVGHSKVTTNLQPSRRPLRKSLISGAPPIHQP